MLFCEFTSDNDCCNQCKPFFFLHLSLTLIIHFSYERTKELLFKVRQFDNSVVYIVKINMVCFFYPPPPPLRDTQFKKRNLEITIVQVIQTP